MNREEYFSSAICRKNSEYINIQKLLAVWKRENNITKMCIVHHRDDTEECRKYNEEHYELWGYNLDGTFEYGKYVLFMTQSEHASHHWMGDSNPMYNPIVCAKVSKSLTGHKVTQETRNKISFKTIEGMRSPDIRRRISDARTGTKASQETRNKISAASKANLNRTKELYHIYLSRGGLLKWNSFQSALKNNNPEVVDLISDLLINKEK